MACHLKRDYMCEEDQVQFLHSGTATVDMGIGEIWEEDVSENDRRCGGQGHSMEYRANVLLIAFNSLHVWGLGYSCASSQILFVLNLFMDGKWKRQQNGLA